ncbi:ATP-binding protein [Clostridium sp. MCC353]|uniref:ATP-binding protein n=1 Tax=Clostridium sp. MCC353 TaxID=2592646 RepID=UPI001C03A31E|nr:ATP-binding protein [Clostridium sp. MCC353]
MRRKIYWNMCLVALFSLILATLVTTGLFYRDLQTQMEKEVATEVRYIQSAMEMGGSDYLDYLSIRGDGNSINRITWVDQDGTVLYDSYKNSESLENHLDRPEIKDALEKGVGSITRPSETLAEQTYYYAVRLSDGTVVRVASTTRSGWASFMQMIPWVVVLTIVIFCITMVLAEIQTKKIVGPINGLNLDNPDEASVYDELSPLIGRIEKQNRTIHRQMDTLREKQMEFSAITENMSEGFIVVDSKAEVVSYNSSAMKILGVEKQMVPDSRVNILNFNRSAEFREAVDHALAGRHAEHNLDLNGHCYQMIANPVLDEGRNKGAIIVILDITEKKGREDLRREFSANVSHELKTPLTSISGYAEIMKNGLVKPEDMARFAENIYTEAQRLITLVGDIIKLSQLDENAVEVEKSAVDLYEVSSDVVKRLQANAAMQKVSLSLQGEPAVIFGARQILDEMIFNLCDNAVKYNKPNGKVTVTVKNDGMNKVVTVADTGIGVPEADKDRIFERFYRVDKSHSKQIGGTGLGLSIVKHGAIYHEARVELESKVSVGTTVRIVF